MWIIGMLVMGLVAGAIARLLVPGRDPMGIVGTMLLGVVGAVIGGVLARAVGDNDGVGYIGAIVGSVLALLVYRAVSREQVV